MKQDAHGPSRSPETPVLIYKHICAKLYYTITLIKEEKTHYFPFFKNKMIHICLKCNPIHPSGFLPG